MLTLAYTLSHTTHTTNFDRIVAVQSAGIANSLGYDNANSLLEALTAVTDVVLPSNTPSVSGTITPTRTSTASNTPSFTTTSSPSPTPNATYTSTPDTASGTNVAAAVATPIVLAFALGVGLWAAWYYRKFPARLTQRFPWLIRRESESKDLTSVAATSEGGSGGKPGMLASLKGRVASLCAKRKAAGGGEEGEEGHHAHAHSSKAASKKKRQSGEQEGETGEEEGGGKKEEGGALGRIRAVLGSALTAALDLFHSLIKRISELFSRLRGGKKGGEDGDAPIDGAELEAAETAQGAGTGAASAKGLALRNINVVGEEGEEEGGSPKAQASPEALSWFKSLPRSTRLYLRGKGAVSNAGGTLDTPFPLDAVAREEIEALVGDATEEFVEALVEFGYAFEVKVVASGGGGKSKDSGPSLPHAPDSRDEEEED